MFNPIFVDDGRVEVRNLIDNKVITLAPVHLTTTRENFVETVGKNTFRTEEFQFRKATAALVKAIQPHEERIKFCEKHLPKIVSGKKGGFWKTMYADLKTFDTSKEFETLAEKWYHSMKETMQKSTQQIRQFQKNQKIKESLSIAAYQMEDAKQMPLETPDVERVCYVCGQPDNLTICPCGQPFHKKKPCSKSRRQTINSRRTIVSRDDSCDQCNENSNQNRNTACTGCMQEVNENVQYMQCIKCPSIFHKSRECVPFGASVLSRTQLICGAHKKSKTKTGFCAICFQSCRRNQCTHCGNVFHKRCNQDRTECPSCPENQQKNIVCAKIMKKWLPCCVVSNGQLPKDSPHKRRKPGYVSVFVIGKNEYIEIEYTNLMSFPTNPVLQQVLWQNEDIEEAIQAAIELHQMVF